MGAIHSKDPKKSEENNWNWYFYLYKLLFLQEDINWIKKYVYYPERYLAPVLRLVLISWFNLLAVNCSHCVYQLWTACTGCTDSIEGFSLFIVQLILSKVLPLWCYLFRLHFWPFAGSIMRWKDKDLFTSQLPIDILLDIFRFFDLMRYKDEILRQVLCSQRYDCDVLSFECICFL